MTISSDNVPLQPKTRKPTLKNLWWSQIVRLHLKNEAGTGALKKPLQVSQNTRRQQNLQKPQAAASFKSPRMT
jgi:hypothetical protein